MGYRQLIVDINCLGVEMKFDNVFTPVGQNNHCRLKADINRFDDQVSLVVCSKRSLDMPPGCLAEVQAVGLDSFARP